MTYSLIVATAIEDINERYAELLGIDELAENLQINKSYLIRRFHKEVGLSPGKYLQTVRIENSKLLLSESHHSLDVIAPLCGFSGANYFCKAFKKETGETPTEFRKRIAPTPKLFTNREYDEIYL